MFPRFLNPIEAHSIHELGLGAIFSIFFWPIAFLVYCLNMTLRFISQRLCEYHYPGRYKMADGEDSVFGVKLHGSSKSYIHGYKIIKGEADLELIRSKIKNLFTLTKAYDRLRYAMAYKFGYFYWDLKVEFDVTKNVRVLDNFNPEEIVDETKLNSICSSMVGTECKEDGPLWEILLIPKYKVPGEVLVNQNKTNHYAVITRIHHAYCDGISFVLLLNNFLADSPGELPIDPMKSFKNPVWIKAYIWAKILLIGPLNFFKNLAVMVITGSQFRVDRYSNRKILARSSKIDMDTLRKIRLASGSSVTSITLSAVYAALYRTHLRLFPGKPVPQHMHLGSVGVMLPYSQEKLLSNQFTMIKYKGPLEVKDPKQRLMMTFEEVRKNASQPDALFNFYMQRALGSLPKVWHEILFSLSGTPVMLSNVPGFKTCVKAFGGEIVDVAAWIPLVTTTGIGLSSQTYCGKMHFCAITDPQLFRTADECTEFLENIIDEINVLAKAYGVFDKGHQNNNNLAMYKKNILDYEGKEDRLDLPQSMPVAKKDANQNETLNKTYSATITGSTEETIHNKYRKVIIETDTNKLKDDNDENNLSAPVVRILEKVI